MLRVNWGYPHCVGLRLMMMCRGLVRRAARWNKTQLVELSMHMYAGGHFCNSPLEFVRIHRYCTAVDMGYWKRLRSRIVLYANTQRYLRTKSFLFCSPPGLLHTRMMVKCTAAKDSLRTTERQRRREKERPWRATHAPPQHRCAAESRQITSSMAFAADR